MNAVPVQPPTSTRELLAAGYSPDEVSRLHRRGTLVHLRRGAYDWASEREVDAVDQHRRLILATVPLIAADAVLSHRSAAVLHGLPVWADELKRVEVTRSGASSGKDRGYVHLHAAPLAPNDVVEIGSLRLTSLARTVVDLGRSIPFDQAVAAGDAALRAGCPASQLAEVLDRSRGRPGVAAARRVVGFSDALSESPGESVSRVIFARQGLPAPRLQFDVVGPGGRLVGRADFCWEEQRTLGEFDGKVKYGRLLKPGETAQDVIYREKRREDAMRDLDWQMVRWGWPDFYDERALAERCRSAFRRGRRG